MAILTHHLTIPYAAFLALGGLAGLLAGGSVVSLLFGGVTSAVLAVVGHMSYVDFKENEEDNQFKSATYSYNVICFIVAALVTLVMGERFMESGNVMPAGIVAGVSLLMTVFYVWKLMSDDVGTHAKRAARHYGDRKKD